MAGVRTNRLKERDREWQEGLDKQFVECTYKAGMNTTLSSVDLEEGDTIPEDSTYEIVRAERRRDPKTGDSVIVVVGMKFVAGP